MRRAWQSDADGPRRGCSRKDERQAPLAERETIAHPRFCPYSDPEGLLRERIIPLGRTAARRSSSGPPSPLRLPAACLSALYGKRALRQPALNGHRSSRRGIRSLLKVTRRIPRRPRHLRHASRRHPKAFNHSLTSVGTDPTFTVSPKPGMPLISQFTMCPAPTG